MKTYHDETVLAEHPEPCAIAAKYGFASVLFQRTGNATLADRNVHAELPVLTFYADFENTFPIPMLGYAITPAGEANTWHLDATHKYNFHYVSRGLHLLPAQLGYPRAPQPYFSARGLQPLLYVSQVVQHMGYPKNFTAPLLALYERHVGAAYMRKDDAEAPGPGKKTARRMLRTVAQVLTAAELTGEQKLDFVTRHGSLAELRGSLSRGVPYTLAAEMFPYYQDNHFD